MVRNRKKTLLKLIIKIIFGGTFQYICQRRRGEKHENRKIIPVQQFMLNLVEENPINNEVQ